MTTPKSWGTWTRTKNKRIRIFRVANYTIPQWFQPKPGQNLALLEEPLAERAFGASFLTKRDGQYALSDVATTRSLADVPTWNTAAITERTAALTANFLRLWSNPVIVGEAKSIANAIRAN